ncbi:HAD family hydrolase [Chloroflexota bacterium]
MEQHEQVILWDFEGTLVDRPGRWRSAIMEVLDVNEPGHQVEMEQIRPYLWDGFPWHRPNEPHTHLTNSQEWWSQVGRIFTHAYQGVGFSLNRARELASLVQKAFTNPERFVLYEDTIPALLLLKEKGWNHVILSNHVPELSSIVDGVGLSPYIDHCITSGSTGYEKPNPRAFQYALKLVGHPERVWMVGDNPIADIQGAESMGIPAILVRNQQKDDVRRYAKDLLEAASIIEHFNSNSENR